MCCLIGLTTNASSSSRSVSSVSNNHDHCYTKPPQGKEQNKRTAAQRKRQGQTFLTPANDNQDIELTTTRTSAAVPGPAEQLRLVRLWPDQLSSSL